MRKVFVTILVLLVFCLCSCSNEEQIEKKQENVYLSLKSSLTQEDYFAMSKRFVKTVDTRATLNDENYCHEVLKPLIKDGELIRKQILEQTVNSENDSLEVFKKMTDEELASLSFLVYNINEIENSEDVNATRAYISSNRLRNCLSFAIGLSAIRNLSVRGVINAATLRRALMAIGKRWLGYVGVVLMVADFYDCYYG